MGPAARTAAIADLNGFLHAFAWVNTKTNHGYTFYVQLLHKASGLQAALEQNFADTASAVRVEPLQDWQAQLRRSLSRWLLAYLRDPAVIGRLTDRTKRFSLSDATVRDQLADVVLAKLDHILYVEQAWRVRITESRHYECDWEDYALESRSRVMLLHLGVSD